MRPGPWDATSPGTAGGATTRRSTTRCSCSPTTRASRSRCEGGTTFTFVTDGIESALEQAREAAGGKDVSLGGGAEAAQQYLAAGLVDEMEISLVPIFLGDGERLLEGLGPGRPKLTHTRTIAAPGVTHLKFERA